MEDSSTNHALTEVALALAMAFFAIMILAMVSMGVPKGKEAKDKPSQQANVDVQDKTLSLIRSKEQKVQRDNLPEGDVGEKTYLFYFNQRYYDAQLSAVSLETLKPFSQIILALPPSLTVDKALQIQVQINHPDVLITQLNQQWLQRLETL
jgi:hypothetical protein